MVGRGEMLAASCTSWWMGIHFAVCLDEVIEGCLVAH